MNGRGPRWFAAALATALLVALVLPIVGLAVTSSPAEVWAGMQHPAFAAALGLSARTTLTSLAVVVVAGTPLAWWLATTERRGARVVEVLVDLPIVIPPAVVGLALLRTLGRQGPLGAVLDDLGIGLPFSTAAVVVAQVVVSAPFYVQAATSAFREVDPDLRLVAHTLGASPTVAFLRVAIPVALPGLLTGVALSWARAVGEFGATLLFAGNLSGTTQTMPLAIYTALESDVRAAVALALVLAAVCMLALAGLRLGLATWLRRRRGEGASPR